MRQVAIDGTGLRAAGRSLSRLPWRAQVDQLAELTDMLTGYSRRRIEQLAAATGLLARAHRWVRARRWHRRLRGARVLTLVGSDSQAVAALLADAHPEVRVQAADWIAQHGTGDDVATMLAALDGDPQLRGYVLVDCLVRAGPRAAGPVASFLERDDVADPAPVLTVAARLAHAGFRPVGLRWSAVGDPQARAAATQLLAAVGDPVAVERLRELLADEVVGVRTAAAGGLGRLQHWPAAPQLAERLADPAFSVRRAAGLALRHLGATGELYLRRGERSDDVAAAAMARQMLSLPEGARR